MSIREDARNGRLARELLGYDIEDVQRENRKLQAENTAMKNELLWIIEDVWPLVHHLTSRRTLKARFLRLNDFMGKRL